MLIRSPHAKRVVVYTWNFHPDLIANAQRQGAHGYLSKTLPASDLVAALEERARRPHNNQRSAEPVNGPRRDRTGPDAAKASPTAKPRSSPSSPRAKTTPTSPG